MAILRYLGDANEGDFSRAPPVGTPLQRQIRAHYTRVDGSLNYSGYFSEILGFPVDSSDFDSASGDDNESSGSGSSSDCVIVSPSSFTGKRSEESFAIVAVGSEVREGNDVVEEISPVAGENVTAVVDQSGGSSPWDPMFNPELFLERMVNLAGNSSRFNATSTDELLKMALGHELKGLLLNYALAARQRAEIVAAREKEILVDKNLATLEEDLKATNVKLEGEMKALKEKCEAEIAKLVKAHDEELAKVKRNPESLAKELEATRQSLIAKDARIATLAKDHEAALTELATLRQEKKNWASEKDEMEETIGVQYDEGFAYALDQVKVLFPDIDRDLLGKADAMLKIDGDKLVSYAPIETTKEPPAKE
ncbi:hypothetical protein QL285_071509 [Trifolium repens]|nr:hypothetical protein QL285_071509 [Trifolium repens]